MGSRDKVVDIRAHRVSSEPGQAATTFNVELEEFSGPFDVLLEMISKHELEVTELALHRVTDEFCAYIRDQGAAWDLDEASAFLVVAATLLDLKAARLLPSGEVEDAEDIAALGAADLLFLRLLQYRAFRDVSVRMGEMFEDNVGVMARATGMDPEFAGLLPDVEVTMTIDEFAGLAATVLAPPEPEAAVGVDHIYAPIYTVSEQVATLAARLRRDGTSTFRDLVADAPNVGVIVGRFLGLLELYRRGVVSLEQSAALGDLHVRWEAADNEHDGIGWDSEFDDAAAPVQGMEDVK